MSQEQQGPPMSAQEEELLKYLEDLQQNNPAEYEMLVQQMQQVQQGKGGKKTGGAGAPPGGIQVLPSAGFVAKTRSATRQGQKTFINICQSDHVDPPSAEEAAALDDGTLPLRIPLSLGPPREDLDKSGEVCAVYDVVFHPDAVEGALKEEEFRSFVMQLTAHQIMQKYRDYCKQMPPQTLARFRYRMSDECGNQPMRENYELAKKAGEARQEQLREVYLLAAVAAAAAVVAVQGGGVAAAGAEVRAEAGAVSI